MSPAVDVAGLLVPPRILPKHYQRPQFLSLLLEISIELLFSKSLGDLSNTVAGKYSPRHVIDETMY